MTQLDWAAQRLLDYLRTHPEAYEHVEDLYRLEALTPIRPWIGEAIDELVATGVLTEAADGRLCLNPRRAA